MIRYRLESSLAQQQYLMLEGFFPHNGSETLQVQLSAWRPGRYELGNFGKNIRGFRAYNPKTGKELSYTKSTKDLWLIEAEGLDEVEIRYAYFANELNAGSTFLDEELLYVNPVNCFFYCPQQPTLSYDVELPDWPGAQLACGLAHDQRKLKAVDFDELADAPFIYSASISKLEFEVDQLKVFIWMHGKHHIQEARIVDDFKRFTEANMNLFRSIPCVAYHFLLLFPTFAHRHGVEHRNSTVIVMGPGDRMHEEEAYQDLLAISCHELFHTWNVKDIRTDSMIPYRFHEENYSELGYIHEGLTTYYGDYLLWRAGVFTDEDWLESLRSHGSDHVWNGGRFHQSVATSSVDTWLDGYVMGAPHRKVSIYNEGYWIACFIDISIRKITQHERGLDDVMRLLFDRFGSQRGGLNRTSFWQAVTDIAGTALNHLEQLAHTTSDYFPTMVELLAEVGVSCELQASSDWPSAHLGMQVREIQGRWVVMNTWFQGPADLAGIHRGDELLLPKGFTSDQWPSLISAQDSARIEMEIQRPPRTYRKRMATNAETVICNELSMQKMADSFGWQRWRQAPGAY